MILFCFHSLCDHLVQKKVWGRVMDSTPDILPGYRRVVHKNGYHDIVLDPKSPGVHGFRMELSTEDYDKVIAWEDNYQIHLVKLKSGKKAMTFILKEKARRELEKLDTLSTTRIHNLEGKRS